MTAKKFDKYFIAHGAARHVKFRKLTTNERHAFFMGVLSIAGQAPVRGCLLIGNMPADAEDIAHEADVSPKIVEGALEKLRRVGVIFYDDELQCDRVHDFEEWNPEPKRDTTGAERQARYRAKMREQGIKRPIPSATKDAVIERDRGVCVACGSADRIEFHHRKPITEGGTHHIDNIELRCFECHRGHASHAPIGDVTSRVTSRVSHAPEVEEKVTPPIAPQGAPSADFEEWALHYESTTGHKLSARTSKAFKTVVESYEARRKEGHTRQDLLDAVVGAHRDQYRRENGYDVAESILRPKKVGELVAKGRRFSQSNVTSLDLAARINRRPVA